MSPEFHDTWLVTGGAGFIGVNFVQAQCRRGGVRIVNLDRLTYAGNPASLAGQMEDPHHIFVQGDIGDAALVRDLFAQYRPTAVLNFAAESHVDRSIMGAQPFVETNVAGLVTLLQESLRHWRGLRDQARQSFRFLQVSTDEVYGSLAPEDPPFSERSFYAPSSPYAASKAAGDHFVRAFHKTHGLPVLTTNCSNNYGPYQFPEKLIPLIIHNALAGEKLPVYGDGMQIRDWIYVADHCEGVRTVLEKGKPGETYNIGGRCERTNLEVVGSICEHLDRLRPQSPHRPHQELITFVEDRPGHDRRYAINDSKVRSDLGWQPVETFDSGLLKTVAWYLEHQDWIEQVHTGAYRDWIRLNYGDRLSEAE